MQFQNLSKFGIASFIIMILFIITLHKSSKKIDLNVIFLMMFKVVLKQFRLTANVSYYLIINIFNYVKHCINFTTQYYNFSHSF